MGPCPGRISAPVVLGDRIIVGSSRLSALTLRDGRMVWQSTGVGPLPTLAVSGDLLVVADLAPGGRSGRLSVFREKTGVPRWKRTLESGAPLGISILDGVACLVSAKKVQAFRVEDSLPMWSVDLDAAAAGPCATVLEEERPGKQRENRDK